MKNEIKKFQLLTFPEKCMNDLFISNFKFYYKNSFKLSDQLWDRIRNEETNFKNGTELVN